MGIFSSLFKRKNDSNLSKIDAIFRLATARLNLTAKYDLFPLGKAGVCFNPMDSSYFKELESELKGLLSIGKKSAGTQYRVLDDDYGFRWVILQDDEFEDHVTAAFLTAQSFSDHGFAGRLLAADFPFMYEQDRIHWIFNYKRGTFYPFVPIPGKQQRDNALELSLSSKIKEELPIESKLERWYGIWGAPFDAVK